MKKAKAAKLETRLPKLDKRKLKKKKMFLIRTYLTDVNFHCAQLSTALRNLANRLDDVRSYHLDGGGSGGDE